MRWINRNDSEANYDRRAGDRDDEMPLWEEWGNSGSACGTPVGAKPVSTAIDLVNRYCTGRTAETVDPSRANENEELKVFTLGVFNSANDVDRDFPHTAEQEYIRPTLVTFTDATLSECGGATKAVGPFYCPADYKMYIDLDFFHQLSSEFRAKGDLAMAYVTAHEVGHHVQKLLGIIDRMNRYRGRVSETEYNRLNVKLELQADFLAGVWVYHAQRMNMIQLEPGDLESAISATTAVGDDTIQKRSMGYSVPDSFTHGTAAQRTYWFRKGMETGDPRQGDTFNDPSLR